MTTFTREDFEHDALLLRTTNADGSAHGSFLWPLELNAVVLPRKWDPNPICGYGLHGLLDGLGDSGLMRRDAQALWWVVGVRREECVTIDRDKVKVPRAKVLYFGNMAGAYQKINSALIAAIRKLAEANAATSGCEANAATSGDGANAATSVTRANAATSGCEANAATSGYGANAATSVTRANAATSGTRANAATSGTRANAATSGCEANAATSGYGANAATSGCEANAATSGTRANAATSGCEANAATSGDGANAATSGTRANAATSGDGANAATSGYGANAATSGTRANAATSGDGAVAAALGYGAHAKAGAGGGLVLVNRDDDGNLVAIRATLIGQNGTLPDVWYRLSPSGQFEAVVD